MEGKIVKNTNNLICSILVGIIITLIGITLKTSNPSIHTLNLVIYSILGCVSTYVLLFPSIQQKIKHLFCDYDWADETIKFYQSIPQIYRKSFWISFGFINLAFLFHTIHFMWGANDWAAIRTTVDNHQSLKDGYFSAFYLQNLLFGGKILPVINNLWSFAGLSLAGVILAIYFNIAHSVFSIVTLTLILSVTPYTLGWMYYTQNTLGNLWAITFSMIAINISSKDIASLNKKYLYNLLSIILLTISLGTFLPVINFILVVILGKILLDIGISGLSLRDTLPRQLQILTNLTASLFIYAFVIISLKEAKIAPEIYNISFLSVYKNIPQAINVMFTQFTTSLPFTGLSYKLLYIALTLFAVFCLIIKSPSAKDALKAIIMLPIILFASQISTLFLITTPHAVTVSFYSLPVIYALMFTILIKLDGQYIKRITYTIAILLIFSSFVRISYALKVWKFGFDAETKLAERIITRMEKMPEFNINNKYKLIQIGSQSLRSKYYIPSQNEKESNALLALPYYNQGNAKDAYNFFYQADFLSQDISIETIKDHSVIRDYILNKARAYPAKESIFIHNDYIIFVLDEKALTQAQRKILDN